MKKFIKLPNSYYDPEKTPDELFPSFEKFKLRYKSPFKPRRPTPPRSKETSPKITMKTSQRQLSLDSNALFIVKIPFPSLGSVTQTSKFSVQRPTKAFKHRITISSRKKRRSGSLNSFCS